MDDMSSRLNEILSDPASMEKIRSLAAMFGNSNQQGGQAPAPPPPQQQQQQQPQQQRQQQQNTQNQQSAPSGAPGIDPEMMRSVMKLAPVFPTCGRTTAPHSFCVRFARSLGIPAAENSTKPSAFFSSSACCLT